MQFRPITKQQFDALQVDGKPMYRLRVEEREWFSDETGNLLGAIVFDPHEECWAWVMLGQDEQRQFRLIHMEGNLPSWDEARAKLRLESGRVAVVPQSR